MNSVVASRHRAAMTTTMATWDPVAETVRPQVVAVHPNRSKPQISAIKNRATKTMAASSTHWVRRRALAAWALRSLRSKPGITRKP